MQHNEKSGLWCSGRWTCKSNRRWLQGWRDKMTEICTMSSGELHM